MQEPRVTFGDPVLVDLHVIAELQAVFVEKLLPRYLASVDDPGARSTLAEVVAETRRVQECLAEVLSNWIAQERPLQLDRRAVAFGRRDFVRDLHLFKLVTSDVLADAAEHAPSAALAERLRDCAAQEREQAGALAGLPPPAG